MCARVRKTRDMKAKSKGANERGAQSRNGSRNGVHMSRESTGPTGFQVLCFHKKKHQQRSLLSGSGLWTMQRKKPLEVGRGRSSWRVGRPARVKTNDAHGAAFSDVLHQSPTDLTEPREYLPGVIAEGEVASALEAPVEVDHPAAGGWSTIVRKQASRGRQTKSTTQRRGSHVKSNAPKHRLPERPIDSRLLSSPPLPRTVNKIGPSGVRTAGVSRGESRMQRFPTDLDAYLRSSARRSNRCF